MKVKCCDEQELQLVTVERVESTWEVVTLSRDNVTVKPNPVEEDRGVEPEEMTVRCDSCGEEFDTDAENYEITID